MEIRLHPQGKPWSVMETANEAAVSKAYIPSLENGLADRPNVQYLFNVAGALV